MDHVTSYHAAAAVVVVPVVFLSRPDRDSNHRDKKGSVLQHTNE